MAKHERLWVFFPKPYLKQIAIHRVAIKHKRLMNKPKNNLIRLSMKGLGSSDFLLSRFGILVGAHRWEFLKKEKKKRFFFFFVFK